MHPFKGKEYGEFLHLTGKKFSDFSEITKEIIAETLRDPGPKGFTSRPINLEIYSPRALKLTVVDLPGLVKLVDTDDGKSEEIVYEMRQMVLQYIQKPENIILAVSPANHDLYNSDALEIAKLVDPERIRTIGVLTKLDLMDIGTNARDILENEVIPLHKGYVGVINRSQKDIEEGKSIDYILKKEKSFFSREPAYRHLANRMGTPYLQQKLQKILHEHIRLSLPKVRRNLEQKLGNYSRELQDLSKKMGGDETAGKNFYAMKQVQAFTEDIIIRVLGNSSNVSFEVVGAGALIYDKLFSVVQPNLNLKLAPDEKELQTLIANIDAIRIPIGVSSLALEAMCKRLLVKYKKPMDDSVRYIAEILEEAIQESAELLNQYPSLKKEVLNRVHCYSQTALEHTQGRLRSHIDAEMFYVNLNHPHYTEKCIEVVVSGKPCPDAVREMKPDELEKMILQKILSSNESSQKKVQQVNSLLMNYLKIINIQISDLTVKYIVYFFIKQVLDFVKELPPRIMTLTNLDTLLKDSGEGIRQMEELKVKCEALKSALKEIENF